MFQKPLNLWKWIKDNEQDLKPPVGNKVVYKDTDFIIMLVGGPNSRNDFHVNEGEEFFYQLKGDIELILYQNGKRENLPIKEGEIFLLPPLVPHSPQRPKDSVGLVVEKRRKENEQDAFEWYCKQCNHKIYREALHVHDIVNQLPPLFERYRQLTDDGHCSQCGFHNGKN